MRTTIRIEDALRVALAGRPPGPPVAGPLAVFGGSGLTPGVDLADPRTITDQPVEARRPKVPRNDEAASASEAPPA